jgi:hypothetical protein
MSPPWPYLRGACVNQSRHHYGEEEADWQFNFDARVLTLGWRTFWVGLEIIKEDVLERGRRDVLGSNP